MGYFIKILFLNLRKIVLLLCVFIVCSNVYLLLYCLEVLVEMEINFKGSYLLLVICCNGLMDLFWILLRDLFKECFIDCDDFDCFVIVLMFYNFKIL